MSRAISCAILLGLLGSLTAGATQTARAEAAARFDGTVQVHGSLRAMMHEDQTSSQVDLSSLAATPHLFGVGALADLAGEVMIVDGDFCVSRPQGDGSITERLENPSGGAALLVSAAVPAWDALVLRSDVTLSEFDSLLADCLVTLPRLFDASAPQKLDFYFANFRGLRRNLFPSLGGHAIEQFFNQPTRSEYDRKQPEEYE